MRTKALEFCERLFSELILGEAFALWFTVSVIIGFKKGWIAFGYCCLIYLGLLVTLTIATWFLSKPEK